MISLEKIHAGNALQEDDIDKIGEILLKSLTITRPYKRESMVRYKEDAIDFLSEYLRKMLTENSGMSKNSKFNTIDILDKLKTQKEHLDMIKLNISASDVQQASKRLSKKSQSAFETDKI